MPTAESAAQAGIEHATATLSAVSIPSATASRSPSLGVPKRTAPPATGPNIAFGFSMSSVPPPGRVRRAQQAPPLLAVVEADCPHRPLAADSEGESATLTASYPAEWRGSPDNGRQRCLPHAACHARY